MRIWIQILYIRRSKQQNFGYESDAIDKIIVLCNCIHSFENRTRPTNWTEHQSSPDKKLQKRLKTW